MGTKEDMKVHFFRVLDLHKQVYFLCSFSFCIHDMMWPFTTIPFPPVSVSFLSYNHLLSKPGSCLSLPATPLQQVQPFQLLLDTKVHIVLIFYAHPFGQQPPSDTGTRTSSSNHLPDTSFLATCPRTFTLKESLVLLSGCFRIMKMIVTTRMAAIISTVFIRMFGSREVRIQIPTIRKPVNRHQRLLIFFVFLDTGKTQEQIISRQSGIWKLTNKTVTHKNPYHNRYAFPTIHPHTLHLWISF